MFGLSMKHHPWKMLGTSLDIRTLIAILRYFDFLHVLCLFDFLFNIFDLELPFLVSSKLKGLPVQRLNR